MTELSNRQVIHEISTCNQNDFAQNLAIAVFSRLFHKQLSNKLDYDTFDSEENHITKLIKTIVLCFVKIRNFYEIKNINYDMIRKNKRKSTYTYTVGHTTNCLLIIYIK